MQVWNIDINKALNIITEKEKDKFIQEANRLLDGIFVFDCRWDMEQCLKEVKNPAFDHIEDNDPEWLYQNNRHEYLKSVVLSYLLTKDEKYLDFFVKFIDNWIDSCPFSEDKLNGVWRTLEVGLRAVNWLFYIQLLHPYLDDSFIEKIEDVLKIHGEILTTKYTTFHKLSNWGVLQDCGLFTLGIYFENQSWIDLAISRLNSNIDKSVMDDGSHWEQSPMYTGEVLSCFLTVINIAFQHSIKLPQSLIEKSKQMTIALTYFMKKDGYIYAFGDSDKIDARDLIAFGAVLFQDGYLKGVANGDGNERIYFHCSNEQIEKYNIIESVTDFTSKALPDSKNYFLKSGSLEAFFASGCLGSGHGHADTLSLCYAIDGTDILIDPGRFTYKNEENRIKLKKASYHNTYTLDDTEFTNPLDTWAYEDVALTLSSYHKYTSCADLVEGAHLGYQNALCKRTVIRLESDALVIFDTIYNKGKHFAKANFSFAPSIKLSNSRCSVKFAQGSITSLSDSSLEIADYDLSLHYNQMEIGKRAIFRTEFEDKCILPYVIDVNNSIKSIEKSKITLNLKNKELDMADGIAIKIKTDVNEYVIFFLEKDVIGTVDLLNAFKREGYGRVIIFKGEDKILTKY